MLVGDFSNHAADIIGDLLNEDFLAKIFSDILKTPVMYIAPESLSIAICNNFSLVH
jgi:hypothetical protein